jgi:hypothetical protein
MLALSSSSSSPLAIRWDSVRQLGCMAQKYVLTFLPFTIHTDSLLCSILTKKFKIFPTNYRARGLNFAASGGSIGSIIAAQVWPVGIANIGSRVYFVFMSVNLVCIPIIYFFYPETNGRSLEDMDELFKSRYLRRTDSKDVENIEEQPVQKL